MRLIQHNRNKGYGASLKTGVRASKFDTLVMLDADGQHDPGFVPKLVELARTYDLVVGTRTKGSNSPVLRRPGKWILRLVASYLVGTRIPDLNSGFRVCHKDLVTRYSHFLPDGFSFWTTLTLAAQKENRDIAWPPIEVARRKGRSTARPIQDGYNTLLLIIRIIVLFDPLKVFLPSSLIIGPLGIVFSIYSLVRFQVFPEGGVLLIVTSILLFFFGILADQISELRRGSTSEPK